MKNINSQIMKNTNALLILNTIRNAAPISRTELVHRVGLTSASVINITNDMIQQGILVQTGKTSEGGQGRKAVMLDVHPNAAYVIGLHLSTDAVHAGVYNLRNEVTSHTTRMVDCNASSAEIIGIMEECIDYCISMINKCSGRILGIGLALPGPLNVDNGIMINPPNFPNIVNVPIKKIIEERFGIPVCCDRESNAAVLAEYSRSFSEKYKSMFFLSLFRKGVGGGFASGGNVLHGFCDGAGEIGHTTVDILGPKCTCGNFGCLEAMVSEEAILSRARKAYRLEATLDSEKDEKEPSCIEDVFTRASLEDPICKRVVNEVAAYISVALGNVISLYSPEVIVLGGTLPQFSPQLVEMIRYRIGNRMYPKHSNRIVVNRTAFGNLVFPHGAAEQAWNEFLPAILDTTSVTEEA